MKVNYYHCYSLIPASRALIRPAHQASGNHLVLAAPILPARDRALLVLPVRHGTLAPAPESLVQAILPTNLAPLTRANGTPAVTPPVTPPAPANRTKALAMEDRLAAVAHLPTKIMLLTSHPENLATLPVGTAWDLQTNADLPARPVKVALRRKAPLRHKVKMTAVYPVEQCLVDMAMIE